MLITRKILVILILLGFFIGGIMDLSNYFIYYHIGALISSIVTIFIGLGIVLTLFLHRRNNPRFSQWLHASYVASQIVVEEQRTARVAPL